MTTTSPTVEAPIPAGWEIKLWLAPADGPHRATVELQGAQMCSLTVSDHDQAPEGAEAVLKLRAASWIAEYLARQPSG